MPINTLMGEWKSTFLEVLYYCYICNLFKFRMVSDHPSNPKSKCQSCQEMPSPDINIKSQSAESFI